MNRKHFIVAQSINSDLKAIEAWLASEAQTPEGAELMQAIDEEVARVEEVNRADAEARLEEVEASLFGLEMLDHWTERTFDRHRELVRERENLRKALN